MAYEVEGRKLARNMERLVVRGRGGRDEADPLGYHRECGQQRHGLQFDDLIARARQRARRTIAFPDANPIGKKDKVALAALGSQRTAPIVCKPEGAIRGHVGMASGRRMISEPPDRHPKVHLPAAHALPFLPAAGPQGWGPQGAAVKSLTSCDMTSGRKRATKPSTKSLLAKTPAQCLRRSTSSSNFHRCTSWLIIPVSPWK